jgi:hypothetical protein
VSSRRSAASRPRPPAHGRTPTADRVLAATYPAVPGHIDAWHRGIDPLLRHHAAGVVDQGDIVMPLGPVDPARYAHRPPFVTSDPRASSLGSDLMDSAHGATPYQLAADPATGRATVYRETSRVGWRGVDTCQAAQPTPSPLTTSGSVISAMPCQSLDRQHPALPLGGVTVEGLASPVEAHCRARVSMRGSFLHVPHGARQRPMRR